MRFQILLILSLLNSGALAQSDLGAPFHTDVKNAAAQYTAGDYEAALRAFRALRSRAPSEPQRVRLQWNIARCLEKLKRFAEALPIFEDYERTVGDPVRSSRARAKVAELVPFVFGSIAVKCTGATGAQIRVETSQETVPCPSVLTRLAPGLTVVLGLAGAGGNEVREVVPVTVGKTSRLTLAFLASKPPPKPVVKAGSHWPWYVGSAALVAASAVTIWALTREDPEPTHRGRVCFESACD